MKRNLNQKLINLIEYYNLNNINLFLSNKPLKRNTNNIKISYTGTKSEKLKKLNDSIKLIKNC